MILLISDAWGNPDLIRRGDGGRRLCERSERDPRVPRKAFDVTRGVLYLR